MDKEYFFVSPTGLTHPYCGCMTTKSWSVSRKLSGFSCFRQFRTANELYLNRGLIVFVLMTLLLLLLFGFVVVVLLLLLLLLLFVFFASVG